MVKITLIDDETAYIRDYYLLMPIKTMADNLGRSHTFVMGRMSKYGYVVPDQIKQKFIEDSRFKKGEEPFNKGKSAYEYMSDEAISNMRKTQFKKGDLPLNTYSEKSGIVTIRKDSSGKLYKYIKRNHGEWDLYHRWLWENNMGEIPKDKIVVFKDGNEMNCQIKNLELITRKENMKRNTIHRYPNDMKTAMKRLSKLKRKIQNAEE